MNSQRKLLTKRDKLNYYITWFVRASLVVAIVFALFNLRYMGFFVSLVTLVLTYIPHFIEKQYRVNLPAEFQLFIVIFVYFGVFLGEVGDFYTRFWWWDSLLHAFSGLALGLAGFLILYTLYKTERLKASPFIIALFTFAFALSMGAVWEIFEFGMDEAFGLDMQKARNLEEVYGEFDTRLGVMDTMIDLILDAIGGFVAAIAGYFYIKNGESFLFKPFIRNFEEANEDIFKKGKRKKNV